MGTRGLAGRTTLSGLTQLYTRHETHCAVHAGRREAAHRADPQLDESWWNHRTEPVPVTGQVNLRGLAPLVVVEVLHGLQQRVRGECTSYCRFLRRLVRELRQTQVSSLRSLPAQEEKARQSAARQGHRSRTRPPLLGKLDDRPRGTREDSAWHATP